MQHVAIPLGVLLHPAYSERGLLGNGCCSDDGAAHRLDMHSSVVFAASTVR
jgi:hypothetical protein